MQVVVVSEMVIREGGCQGGQHVGIQGGHHVDSQGGGGGEKWEKNG